MSTLERITENLTPFQAFTAPWETLSDAEQVLAVHRVRHFVEEVAEALRDSIIRDGVIGVSFGTDDYINLVIRDWEDVDPDRVSHAVERWTAMAESGKLATDPRYRHARTSFMGVIATAKMKVDTGLRALTEATDTEPDAWEIISAGPPDAPGFLPMYASRTAPERAIVISEYQDRPIAEVFVREYPSIDPADYEHLEEWKRPSCIVADALEMEDLEVRPHGLDTKILLFAAPSDAGPVEDCA